MSTNWIEKAQRLGDGSIGGAMDHPSVPGRVVWHTTESGTGDDAFTSVAAHLIRVAAEPHLLYDPTTDRLGQYGPLNHSARALRNDGSTRSNRVGKVCIQIEVLGRAAKPFTKTWKPGPNYRAMMAAIRSWNIPDTFPAGRLATSGADATNRPRSVWMSKGGHYGHANIPGNDHWDPGSIDKAALFEAAPAGKPGTGTSPAKPVVDLSNLIAAARRDPGLPQGGTTHKPDVLVVEKALVAEGLLPAQWADGSFGSRTVEAYAALQRRYGFSGADANGIPGQTTLGKLGRQHGFTVKA
ncbi:peptidoglycan hydrolase-like protein with peptidoglycan-binding domain [Streptomyces aurantiacus]|uniref:peptidoglycan-binding domain-containing protein n=1 Tax=Streptomyces aurantiacus TaxID=47760 RepID=UPI002794F425|nr:peptidoglycan-binding domain-containing protein [Streptomyces aurantiacus]MDQ0773962.1 peptidoglycan hydrolase-like protein with peptidoglycan-binding domain [Streptomyces aurantiacus]